ncbi:MAG: GNAT family N-acetyltransferase [Paucibacter sp.]|nr:GNAT family N-acetyltransferase [Roseateles sp.]
MARVSDLENLCVLEQTAFAGDRISRRSWKRLIDGTSNVVMLIEYSTELAGALVMLYRKGSTAARIYSIATAPSYAGKGLGGHLLSFAKMRARHDGFTCLRLETRIDNHRAQTLFRRHGFEAFERKFNYYEDGADALRFHMPLRRPERH